MYVEASIAFGAKHLWIFGLQEPSIFVKLDHLYLNESFDVCFSQVAFTKQ